MAAYVYGAVTVTDPSWLEEYGPAVDAMVQKNGGKYVARDLAPDHLEGGGSQPTVIVILEFPTKEQARAWYDSPEYQPFIKMRQGGATGDLFLVDGL
ncbi:MAG: DUF1330 domain-containing protein [Rhodospirillaceae bacterium]|jgi:uncharacterized protein (DUF1330 family)|nr:DUF1330 domain-containing protein [Rhodospirillaceae bacterium]